MSVVRSILLLLFFVATPAHASWHWITVARVGDGSMANPYRPALGEAKPDVIAMATGAASGGSMLVLVRIKDGTGYTTRLTRLKAQGTYWGKEGKGRVISSTLRGALVKEAKRLGAPPDWKPEGFSLGQEY